jgi:type II secretory pathway component GspD/PulD (secretin)
VKKLVLQQYYRGTCGILIFFALFFARPYIVFAELEGSGAATTAPSSNLPFTDSNPLQAAPSADNPAGLLPASMNTPEEEFSSQMVIPLKYIKADQVKNVLISLMPNLRVEAMNNMLIIVGNWDDMSQAKAILEKVDKAPRQVMFEAQVIELSLIDLKNIGFNWGTSTALPEVPNEIAGNAFHVFLGDSRYGVNFKATVNRLLQNKKGRLLASPRIAALDGQTAQIMIGDRLAVESKSTSGNVDYWTVSWVDAAIKLEVTPTVHADDTITTHIKPEVSNKTDTTPQGNPNIRTRQAETTLRVKNGETIVLGGLIQREESRDVVKVPILGNIPLVGQFFRSTNKEKRETELIILITPQIMDLPQ